MHLLHNTSIDEILRLGLSTHDHMLRIRRRMIGPASGDAAVISPDKHLSHAHLVQLQPIQLGERRDDPLLYVRPHEVNQWLGLQNVHLFRAMRMQKMRVRIYVNHVCIYGLFEEIRPKYLLKPGQYNKASLNMQMLSTSRYLVLGQTVDRVEMDNLLPGRHRIFNGNPAIATAARAHTHAMYIGRTRTADGVDEPGDGIACSWFTSCRTALHAP